LTAEQLGKNQYFIVEEMEVDILFHKEKALDISLPTFIEKVIAETEPGARGNTASNNVQKPARIDNGYEFQVPIFINEGDVVRIDTRTGEYSDRVSKA
jgi:elongation factor P